MAASSSTDKKTSYSVFTRESAAQVRRTIEREQKTRADSNLMTLRFMTAASRDVNPDDTDSMMASKVTRIIAEKEHPPWEAYDPLDKSEHIHRYPVSAEHRDIMHMVNITYTNIAQYLNDCIRAREIPVLTDCFWLQLVADCSCGALQYSSQRWEFSVPAYQDLKFTAHQLLFFDTNNAKLFIITVNDTTPYDYFFYFF